MPAGGAWRWGGLFCAFAYSAHFMASLEKFQGGTLRNIRNDPLVLTAFPTPPVLLPLSTLPNLVCVPARFAVYWLGVFVIVRPCPKVDGV